MRTSTDALRERLRRPAAADPQVLAAVARDCLRRERERAAAPDPSVPAIPRATREPWSRRKRPAGSAPTIELIRSLARGERTRQQ